jgi:hypothetical protein
MTQENPNENQALTSVTAISIKGDLLDWLVNNFLFAAAPLFVSYLALTGHNPAAIFNQGDAFIITAALLAPEIAALRNLQPSTVTRKVKSLISIMLLLVILSTILFVASASDYNTTHPDIPVSKLTGVNGSTTVTAILGNRVEAAPPFPTLTPTVVDITSVLALLAAIVLIYHGIRERQRVGSVS